MDHFIFGCDTVPVESQSSDLFLVVTLSSFSCDTNPRILFCCGAVGYFCYGHHGCNYYLSMGTRLEICPKTLSSREADFRKWPG
jgi:hypothetical protein